MFSGFFNYDNPVWRFIGKFFDVMILNILWIICSIPIVTIGASTTAVYYVTLKLVRDEDGATIKSFFKSFKENFKQATIIWLIMLVLGIVLGVDIYVMVMMKAASTFRKVVLSVILALTIVYGCVLLYVFPLQSRFYNSVKRTLFNAFFMSIRHFFQTIGMLAMDIGLIAMVVIAVPMLQPLLFLFGFPLIAFLNSFVFTAIFEKYMPKKQEETREESELEWPEG